MRLTWHIVRKDLVRLRLPLAVWILAFLAEFAVGIWFLNAGTMSYKSFENIQSLDMVFFGLRLAIGYLLVAALVLDDPLVGTTAFWPTRPISGSRLMGAKLIAGLLIFGLLPILVTLPWWLYCGYGVHQVYEAGLDSLGVQVVPVAFGLLIAALVGSFARFLAGTIFAAAAIALFLAAFVKMAKTHLFFHGLDVIVDSSAASAARLSILYAFAIVGWAVVVAQQFLTRRLNRSLVLLSFTAALLGVDAIWWPLAFKEDFFRTRPAPADGAVLDDRVAIHHLKGAALHIEQDPGIGSGTVVFGNIQVDGAPPELFLRCDAPVFEWRWPDGSSAHAQGTLVGTITPTPYQLRTAVPFKETPDSVWKQSAVYKQLRKDGRLVTSDDLVIGNPTNRVWDYYFEVPRAVGIRMLSDPPSCTIDFGGDIMRPRLMPEIPLVTGNGWAGSGEGIRIARKEWNGSRKWLEVSVVEHRAAMGELFSLWYGGTDQYNMFSYSNRLNNESTYFAINRRLGESAWPVSFSNLNFSIRIATVAIAWRWFVFIGPSNEVTAFPAFENGKWPGPSYEDWFSDVSLGRAVETAVGRFSRKITINPFPVVPDQFSKAP